MDDHFKEVYHSDRGSGYNEEAIIGGLTIFIGIAWACLDCRLL